MKQRNRRGTVMVPREREREREKPFSSFSAENQYQDGSSSSSSSSNNNNSSSSSSSSSNGGSADRSCFSFFICRLRSLSLSLFSILFYRTISSLSLTLQPHPPTPPPLWPLPPGPSHQSFFFFQRRCFRYSLGRFSFIATETPVLFRSELSIDSYGRIDRQHRSIP